MYCYFLYSQKSGCYIRQQLLLKIIFSHVTKTAFFHLRNICKLRKKLTVSDAEKVVNAFMTPRLNYCNAMLGGCPSSSINKLQVVQNAGLAARVKYKILLLLTYKALNGLAPAYLTSLLSRYNPTCSLRSQNSGLLVVPRIAKSTKGARAFSYLAPKLWNSLPDNVRGSDTLSLFKSRLKTHLLLWHIFFFDTQRRRSHFFTPCPRPYFPCLLACLVSSIERLSLHGSPN